MSRTLVQPIGQKRLTNVAVVRLKKHGIRFEVACYKNKALSWRSGILEKGELQVAGKERESQLSNQFRDVATIVMQKTVNPETQRPCTISMIERLMHEIHFAVDPHSSSKKQALEVISELQKQFPIKRCPMRLLIIVPEKNISPLMEKLNAWNASIASKDVSGSQLTVVCEIEPGFFRECDSMTRNWQGRLKILSVSVHVDGDAHVNDYEDEIASSSFEGQPADAASELNEVVQKQPTISTESANSGEQTKQHKCSTCNALVGDANQYRDHFKCDWHKHNLKRKTRQLPPLMLEDCMIDMQLEEPKNDLKDYSF